MTLDLTTVTSDDLQHLVGESFQIDANTLELLEIIERNEGVDGYRNQFSLMFEAPPRLQQYTRIAKVSHPGFGTHDLLISHVLNGRRGTALEVCFG